MNTNPIRIRITMKFGSFRFRRICFQLSVNCAPNAT